VIFSFSKRTLSFSIVELSSHNRDIYMIAVKTILEANNTYRFSIPDVQSNVIKTEMPIANKYGPLSLMNEIIVMSTNRLP